jgi:hypothetical protein
MNTATLAGPALEAEPLNETVSPRAPRRPRRDAADSPAPATATPAQPAASGAKAAAGEKQAGAKARPREGARKSEPIGGDLLLYGMLAALVWAAWKVSEMGLVKPNSDTNYWVGVTGGSMMLVLFIYPLRKYFGFMQGLGHVKWWFWFHLLMGVGGPWLILAHSNFRVSSLNASVALYSMLIVVCSGVVGRFIYVRIHRGLDGERTSYRALRERAGFVESNARTRLHFSPRVEKRLLAFEHRELRAQPGWATYLRQVTLLPTQQWITYLRCIIELQRPLHKLAKRYHWSAEDLRRRKRRARKLVHRYLDAVVRVAQFQAYERVFALWHLAHLPFIYLLVISAIVHVVAVHAY